MTATIKFDQVGVPAGIDNRARSDIVAGTLLTITNVTPGTVNTLELLWRPPGDDTAVLIGSGPVWTLLPKAGTSGSYRFRLTVDGEVIKKRVTTRTINRNLPKPAANEIADPTASLVKNTAAEINKAENNEAFGPFTAGSAFGWWPDHDELVDEVDDIRSSKSETLVYTDDTNKVIGPLTLVPVTSELSMWIIGGIGQEYGVDFTVRQVTGGSAPGYYVCIDTGSTAPGGGTFLSGSNPTTGIDQLISGDKVRTVYPTYTA